MYTTSSRSQGRDEGDFIEPKKKLVRLGPLDQVQQGSIGAYCSLACNHFDVLGKTIRHHGHRSLTDYLNRIQPSPLTAFQPNDDLFDLVYRHVTPQFGRETARQAIHDLERVPLVLTANHHGVTYFPQDFQGSLIFALNRIRDGEARRTIPVFACGTIPLDNLTFPLGMLCYDTLGGDPPGAPKKLPVFSNKMRRQLVSCAKPFDRAMIERARRRSRSLVAAGEISVALDGAIHALLVDHYNHPDVVGLPSYTQQASALNYRIWHRVFQTRHRVPDLLPLELEKVAIGLLEKDLTNFASLAHCVMFDTRLRDQVFNRLDGERACWRAEFLRRRLHLDRDTVKKPASTTACGTMLFWGIDARGRRVPLYLQAAGSGKEILSGVGDNGRVYERPYSAGAILDGLRRNQLLPSIFTSLLTLSLARGVVCAGGYYQGEYLPAMQRGLVEAMGVLGGYGDVVRKVSNVKTDAYFSGMIAVMRRTEAGNLVPAGPLEIIAGGGIGDEALSKMMALSVKDAHLGALAETIEDLPAAEKAVLPENWRSELAQYTQQALIEKIVVV
jgi:hypothetical protein